MPSIREQILQDIESRLRAASTGAAVFRSRAAALASGELPSITILPEDEDDTTLGQSITRHEFIVRLEVNTRGDIPDQLADPIIVAAHEAIMLDTTLGGLCSRIEPAGTKWELDDADNTAGATAPAFRITYLTPWSSPARRA